MNELIAKNEKINLIELEVKTDFLLHIAINNSFEGKNTEERLKLYEDYLKMRLSE